MHASNQPTIIFGNRGNAVVRLTVYGAKSNLHSGHYGNYVPESCATPRSTVGLHEGR